MLHFRPGVAVRVPPLPPGAAAIYLIRAWLKSAHFSFWCLTAQRRSRAAPTAVRAATRTEAQGRQRRRARDAGPARCQTLRALHNGAVPPPPATGKSGAGGGARAFASAAVQHRRRQEPAPAAGPAPHTAHVRGHVFRGGGASGSGTVTSPPAQTVR